MHTTKTQEIAMPSMSATYQLPDKLKNRLLVTPVEAGACLGWAKQTVYNKLKDDFPIPIVKINGRRMVRVFDLLQYISGLKPETSTFIMQPRRPGRPSKAESIRLKGEMRGAA